MENDRYPFVNLPLPYAFDALEPWIDEKTMMLHHDRHLQTYIDRLNAALKDAPRLQRLTLEQLLCKAPRLPEPTKTALLQNAGGVYNHRFYFALLQPPADTAPSGALAEAIDRDFGGFDAFRAAFQKAALGVFGSGYAWLVLDCGKLKIVTTANQDTPLPQHQCPVLTIDVWEHAYYLKHYNVRADYIAGWFHVVNWTQAEENYRCCLACPDCCD